MKDGGHGPTEGNQVQAWRETFKQAVKLHERAIAGDKKAGQQAYQLFKKIHGMARGNNTVEAYLGSSIVLQGRDSKNPEEKVRKVVEGLKLLDRAVGRDANNIEIRILRAYVCKNLPDDIFHRRSTAREDFNFLVKRHEKYPGSMTDDFVRQLRRDLANL